MIFTLENLRSQEMVYDQVAIMECPFCGYKSSDVPSNQQEYAMLLHMESNHPEDGRSPFVPEQCLSDARENEADDAEEVYVECPVDDCNEVVVRSELEYHIELHAEEADDTSSFVQAEEATNDHHIKSSKPPQSQDVEPWQPRRSSRTVQGAGRESSSLQSHRKKRHQSTLQQAWENMIALPSSKRKTSEKPLESSSSTVTKTTGKKLGKAELGKYAHEDQMPEWLVSLLKKGGQEVGEGVIPVLEQLLEQSPSTMYAYLCDPCVQHVSKLKREGGFCGYRNIQMMASYINGVGYDGSYHFKGKLPSIFDIQELIEAAWDQGINKQGRMETGGVRGTRKYIGTPEAQAVYVSLGMPVEAQGFKQKEPGKAQATLMQAVERYFKGGQFDPADKVRCTALPPIYFQHAGHSMTIIGFEKLKNGTMNLLVFDPMFRDAENIAKRVGKRFEHMFPDLLLKPYRRGDKYLKKYREFEVLRLRPPIDALERN